MKKTIIWILVAVVVAVAGYAWVEYSAVKNLETAVAEAEAVVVEKAVLPETATAEEKAAAEEAYNKAEADKADAVKAAKAALAEKLASAPVSWFVCDEAESTEADCKECPEAKECTEAPAAEQK